MKPDLIKGSNNGFLSAHDFLLKSMALALFQFRYSAEYIMNIGGKFSG